MNVPRRNYVPIWTVILALTLSTLVSPPASASLQAQVTGELRAPLLPYHRSASLVLRVECPRGTTVQWPELSGKLQDVEVRASDPVSSDRPDDKMVTERTYRLDPLKPGSYRLPDVDVSLSVGAEMTAYPLPVFVLQARELTDEEKKAADTFVESVPLSSLQLPESNHWGRLLVPLLIVAAAAFLWWKFYRKKPQPVAPPRPPWEVALARLHELRLRNLPILGQTERYFVDLSAILRYYVEDRFGLHAPEQTTPEFLDIAAQSGLLTGEQQEFLALFLKQSDRVKFARHEPSVVEMEERLGGVEHFVRGTIPGPAADAGSEVAA